MKYANLFSLILLVLQIGCLSSRDKPITLSISEMECGGTISLNDLTKKNDIVQLGVSINSGKNNKFLLKLSDHGKLFKNELYFEGETIDTVFDWYSNDCFIQYEPILFKDGAAYINLQY